MYPNTKLTPLALANTYAKFFVEDFAVQVMGNLRGSHSIPQDVLSKVVTARVAELAGESLTIVNTNAIGRFLFECADYALENNVDDVTSRAAWDQVRALPSAHHAELNTIAFSSADLYRTTVDQNVIGTLARDANVTAKLIQQAAENRSNITETGGSLNMFSWGILTDGLWLNGALSRANDRAGIYKEGHTTKATWAQTAFEFALQAAPLKPIDRDVQQQVKADINLLLGTAAEETLAPLLHVIPQAKLDTLLTNSGSLLNQVEYWNANRAQANRLMTSVGEMSALARLLELMQNAAATQEIGDELRGRLDRATEALTMALVGYEVMRETRFADSLILGVATQGDDPKVDVFVNSDVIAQYRNSGVDEDLVAFGHHLDPRQGMPESSNGWSLQFVTSNRDKVLSKVATQSIDRLEKLRNNDASFIRAETQRITTDAVQSYLNARSIEIMPNTLKQAIGRLSQDIVSVDATIKLDEQLTGMLAQAQGDPFVQQAASVFVGYLNDDTGLSQYARAATVADLAISDAVNYITAADIPQE